MAAVRAANLALRFLLELGALAAVGYWGWETGDGVMSWILLLAGVGAVIAVWWLFVAPKASIDLARPLRFAIELAVWVTAAAALVTGGQAALGLAFGAVAVVSGTLNYAWA